MGKDVYKVQIKYLTETPQPTNLATTEWCDRVAVINAGLEFLKNGAKPMSEEEVVDKVITANLKPELMQDFILKKGNKASTLKEVKQILRRIDRANEHMKQATEKLLKSKPKEKKEKKPQVSGTSICRLRRLNINSTTGQRQGEQGRGRRCSMERGLKRVVVYIKN